MRKFLVRGCMGLALIGAVPLGSTGCLSGDLLEELEDILDEIGNDGFFDDDDDFGDDADDFFDDLEDAFD